MGEGLSTAAGEPLGVPPADPSPEFSAAMVQAAAAAGEYPPPPPRDPEAPFGRKADGTPKRGPGGRPPKDKATQPRVQAVPSPAAPGPGGPRPDYTQGLQELCGGVWSLLAPFAPADAGAVLVCAPALTSSWNALAQHDPRVGRIVAVVCGGTMYGAAISSVLMLGLQLAANHGRVHADAVAHFGVRSREELEAVNAAALAQTAEQLRAEDLGNQAAAA